MSKLNDICDLIIFLKSELDFCSVNKPNHTPANPLQNAVNECWYVERIV
jgi:hypothetical protein